MAETRQPLTPTEALDLIRDVLHSTVDKNTVTDVRPALAVLEGVVKDDPYQRGYDDGYSEGYGQGDTDGYNYASDDGS